jgi:iron-sulfur cluster assembly protein
VSIIDFTPAAKEAIQQYQRTLHIPEGHYLRIGIKQKNAQQKGLVIGFDEKGEKDKEAVIDGIPVIYHPGQALFFAGMEIDHQERDGKKGFVLVEKKRPA